MLHDLDLISHSFPGDIDIFPISDVHLGAMEHAETEWQSFIKSVEKSNAYLILAGDATGVSASCVYHQCERQGKRAHRFKFVEKEMPKV